MSNLIYEKCIEMFASDDADIHSALYSEILSLISKSLKNGEDSSIAEALNMADEDGKSAIFVHINEMVSLSVTTIPHSNIDSNLFILPVLFNPQGQTLSMPSIRDVEQVIRDSFMSKISLDLPFNAVNFAPVSFSYKSVLNMNMTEWHKIHRAAYSVLDKRADHSMYRNPFFIKTENDAGDFPENVQMFFFAFTVTTAKSETERVVKTLSNEIFSRPIGLELQQFLNLKSQENDWVVLPFGTVDKTTTSAFDFYQVVLTENLASRYSQSLDCSYALVPTNDQASFALLVWNSETNNVIDGLVLNPYQGYLDDLTTQTLDLLSKYNVQTVYVGSVDLPLDYLMDLSKINFASYLKKFGAAVLKPDSN